jgi:hypothetical protein
MNCSFNAPLDHRQKIVEERCLSMKDMSLRSKIETSELLERLMFASASTMEEYMDKSKIESKLKDITARVLRRRLRKRQRMIAGSSSKMVVSAQRQGTIADLPRKMVVIAQGA